LQKRTTEKSIVSALRESDDDPEIGAAPAAGAHDLATPHGSVLYTRRFAVDRAPSRRLLSRMPGELEEFHIPYYDEADTEAAGSLAEDDAASSGAGPACFNCGRRGHAYRDCAQRLDHDRVRAARSEQPGGGGQGGDGGARYYASGGAALSAAARWPQYRAGAYSDALRAALGMPADVPDAAPPFVHRMRRAGYPPGYLDPSPDPSMNLHWGYAENGPVSSFVRAYDAGYNDGGARGALALRRRAEAATVTAALAIFGEEPAGMQAAAAVAAAGGTGERPPSEPPAAMAAPSDEVEEGEVGVAAPPPAMAPSAPGHDALQYGHAPAAPEPAQSDLFAVPGAEDTRLTPFFPVCTCGRALLAALPGLNVDAVVPADAAPQAPGATAPSVAVPAVVTASWCIVHKDRARTAPQLPRRAVPAGGSGGGGATAVTDSPLVPPQADDDSAETDTLAEAAKAGTDGETGARAGQRLQRWLQQKAAPTFRDEIASAIVLGARSASAEPTTGDAAGAGTGRGAAAATAAAPSVSPRSGSDMDVSDG
jgi:hypothetical protein